jgi:RecB family endonuclease NucS
MAFERVAQSPDRFLTIDPGWSEAQLEAFVIQSWENIDWGFASPLYLVGTQVQLDSETRDRVDILAKGGSGQLVAIELKIGEAKPRDVSQLQAYMTHLDRRGEGTTFGVLVAASFPPRVLNAAMQHRRIRLLRFSSHE